MSYSHSKINTFETCRRHYYYKYIRKLDEEEVFPTTIEKFMGGLVHEIMEKLYKDVLDAKIDTKEYLLDYFDRIWDENYTEDILIADSENPHPEHYRDKGKNYISMYYDHHYSFKDMQVLSIEETFFLKLPDGNEYYVKMDKLARVGDVYYVCDYKTDGKMKTQETADKDRQLAMYSIWVKKNYPQASKVRLLWHMLKFDTDVISDRTDEQLSELVDKVVKTIAEIESIDRTDENAWPISNDAPCKWCEYKKICPKFKETVFVQISETDVEDAANELLKVKNEIIAKKSEEKALEARRSELEKVLKDYALSNGLTDFSASGLDCSVEESPSVKLLEENKEAVLELIKRDHQKYIQIGTSTLYSDARKGKAPKELDDLLEHTTTYKVTVTRKEE